MAKIRNKKEEADKLMKVSGNINGALLKALYEFIMNKKGEEGVEKVEKRLAELGYPFDLKRISSFGWYPAPYICLVCLVILEVFDWDEKEAYQIGYDSPLYSIITKLLIKYLVSLDKIYPEIPRYFKKHYDFGSMEGIELNTKGKYIIMRLTGFKKIHPIWYVQARGYLARLVSMCTQSQNVKAEQLKCLYNGDPYDEFKLTW